MVAVTSVAGGAGRSAGIRSKLLSFFEDHQRNFYLFIDNYNFQALQTYEERDTYIPGLHAEDNLRGKYDEPVGKPAKGMYEVHKDSRKKWSKEAEQFLIQCVKDTDRDENWKLVAERINAKYFLYEIVDTHGGKSKPDILHVQGDYCRLYYDRHIRGKELVLLNKS